MTYMLYIDPVQRNFLHKFKHVKKLLLPVTSNDKGIIIIIKTQSQLIFFLKNSKNKDRSLDCWKEVVDFKQAVTEEQKKFIAAHQK